MKTKLWAGLSLCVVTAALQADLVVMDNGDRYHGRVLTVTASNLVFQSEVLGPVNIPRVKVANVAFGTNTTAIFAPSTSLPSASAKSASPGGPKASDDLSAALRQIGSHTNLIQKVQEQFLTAAGPEASAKFKEILNDLTTGKMTVGDLRAQARDVAEQLRALQQESGEDGGFTADLYLSILDRFLEDTNSLERPKTNSMPLR